MLVCQISVTTSSTLLSLSRSSLVSSKYTLENCSLRQGDRVRRAPGRTVLHTDLLWRIGTVAQDKKQVERGSKPQQ